MLGKRVYDRRWTAMNLRNVDLNLLHVFDAVMKHRSVAQAAQLLSLSPSAVSHALGRLRHALKDELFVRGEAGMQPTPRALELAAPVRGSLALLEQALVAAPFVPAESIRTFRLATGDYVCALILPALVQRFAQRAPHIDLKISPVNRLDVARQLDGRAVDVVVGWFDSLPAGLRRKPLVQERGVLVVREGHPLTQRVVTAEHLFDFPHVVVELTGTQDMRDDGFLDDHGVVRRVWMERVVLEARGRPDLSARVAVSVPHFAAVPPLLRMSDMVATLPLRLAQSEVSRAGLVMLDPSLEPGTIMVEAVWHSRDDGDRGLCWLLDELVAASAGLASVT
jgi:DNA-binding transcriptional LysR family regulator